MAERIISLGHIGFARYSKTVYFTLVKLYRMRFTRNDIYFL